MDLKALVKRRIDTLKQSTQDSITGGSIKDFSEYQRLVGRYQGLTDAYNEIEGILGDEDADEPGG